MAVELEIEDGSPRWYLSPNIWTVPGEDPEGEPGMPIVDTPCFMWAHVQNNGSTPVNNALVRFYWANPSVGFDRTTAHYIGSSNVSLAAGEERDVLCLTPWVPTFVNEGHECALAEAFHSSEDPLPDSPVFNVPTDRHVAQRNLSVVQAMTSKKMMFSVHFSICNSSRKERTFRIYSKHGKIAELLPLQKTLGRLKIPHQATGTIEQVGFVFQLCPTEEERAKAQPVLEKLKVPGKRCIGATVIGKLNGEAALIHIMQEVDGKEVGGLSILALSEKFHQTERKEK